MNALPRSVVDHTYLRRETQTLPADASLVPFGFGRTMLVYGGAAVLLWVATRLGVPLVQRASGCESVVAWFVAGGVGFFLPLAILGLVLLRNEGGRLGASFTCERLWCGRMSGADWAWGLAGLLGACLLGGASMLAIRLLYGNLPLHPPFLSMEPLSAERWWILAAWIPFFFLNILGEEFLWHAVLLPRQQAALGRWAWLASGLGWLFMHMPFGLPILVTLWPVTMIVPYLVQRRRNVWLGVLIHAGLNGPGFLAVAFGVL